MNSPQAPKPGPRPLRLLLIALAAIVVLIGITWAAVVILLPPARVRAILEQQANAALNRPIRIDDVTVGIFPPVRVRVHGLALAEPGGFETGAAFQTQALLLDVNVFALLGRRVVVQRLTLDQP